MQTYRVDYQTDGGIVGRDFGTDRRKAMAFARKQSNHWDVAYAISTIDGKDSGQRVYAYGGFSHQDDVF